MTREREIEILMIDRCTRKEAERFLKNGTTIFTESTEDIETLLNDCTCEEERSECKKMIEDKIPATDWGIVEDDGKMYYIRYVL